MIGALTWLNSGPKHIMAEVQYPQAEEPNPNPFPNPVEGQPAVVAEQAQAPHPPINVAEQQDAQQNQQTEESELEVLCLYY